MKTIIVLFLMIAALFAAGALPAYAHGGHVGFYGSVWIGPGWWGAPYPYYYDYDGPPVVIEQQPPVTEYEEQAPQVEEQPYYWYFCPDAKTYYPYVKECPSGWLKVIPPKPKGAE